MSDRCPKCGAGVLIETDTGEGYHCVTYTCGRSTWWPNTGRADMGRYVCYERQLAAVESAMRAAVALNDARFCNAEWWEAFEALAEAVKALPQEVVERYRGEE